MKYSEHQGFPSPDRGPGSYRWVQAYSTEKYGMIRGWGKDPPAKYVPFSQRPSEQAGTDRRF